MMVFTAALPAFAQSSGDFQSIASGNWNVAANWQTYNGSAWVAATAAPTSAASSGVVTITTGTSITNTASLTMDQIVVQSGATLAATSSLTLANGTGTDLDIFGTFLALGSSSTLTLQAGSSVIVESGGVFIHNGTSGACVNNSAGGTLEFTSGSNFTLERAGGTVPIATWDFGSIAEVSYSTASTSKPAPQGQNFSGFIWNNPLQSASLDLSGVLTNFSSDFVLASSGGQELKWSGDANFGGNLTINNGSLNVSGSSGTRLWTLTGNLNIAAGAQLNVSASASGSYTLLLNGTGIQNYTCAGANIATKLNWNVTNTSTLNLNNDLPLSTAGRTLTANGTVNLNGHTLTADLLAGTGTVRNQGGGSGLLVFGVGNSTNTLDGTLALVDGTSGTLGLVKGGNSGTAGLLTITAPFTYSGGLTVSNGFVLVNNATGSGTGSGGIDVLNGTLGGTGAVTGPVAINGGALSPGVGGIGKFTINGTLALSGNTYIEIDKSNAQTNDVVAGLSTVTYGGTLTATNIGVTAFAAGDAFKIFKASSYLGSFGAIVPATPAAGLAWDTSTLKTDGTLRIIAMAVTSPTLSAAQSGNSLTFSWSDPTFKLQVQTNSSVAGLSTNWFDYPGGAASPVPVTIDPGNPNVFFRLSQ